MKKSKSVKLTAPKRVKVDEELRLEVIEVANAQWHYLYADLGDEYISLDIVKRMIDSYDDTCDEVNYKKLKYVLLPALRKMNENERLKKLKILFSTGKVTVGKKKIDMGWEPIKVYKKNTQQVIVNKVLRQEVLDLIDELYTSFIMNRNKDEIAIQVIQTISMEYCLQNSMYCDIYEYSFIPLLKSFNENERLEYVKTLLTYGSVEINGKKFSMPDLPNLKGIKIKYGE